MLGIAPITYAEHITPATVSRKLSQATQTIIDRGVYTNPSGVDITISSLQAIARQQRARYGANDQIAPATGRYGYTHAYVYNNSVLTVARERARQGYRVALLNFASNGHRGPEWLDGYPVQEESLMRSSSMMYCMHDFAWMHESVVDGPFYDDTVAVTPRVPVFRDHGGDLLDEPWQCDIVHACAVDARTIRQVMPEREAEVPQLMVQRALRVLHVAATTRANVLVLGAWGCGQAGNDSAVMAAVWQVAIEQAKLRTFGIIDFAVADVEPGQPVYTSFVQRLHKREFVLT